MAASISFTRGVPSADLLPVDDIRASAAEALERDAAGALSYSPGGYLPLREWIGERHGVPASRVLMVNGSLQGLAFLADHFFHDRPGAIVLEDPTYDRTLTTFRHAGADVRAVPLRDDGVDVELFGAAAGRAADRRLSDPHLPEPVRGLHVARDAAAGGGAGPRARRPRDRGRPVRAAAVRGRAAADAARARPRERDPFVILHQDDRARRAHRIPGAPGAPRRAASRASPRTPTSLPTRWPRRRLPPTAGAAASSPTWSARRRS